MSGKASPDPALRARVLAAAAREQSPTRSSHRWRSLLLIAVFVALVLAEFMGFGGMRGWGMPRSPLLILATVTGLVGCATGRTLHGAAAQGHNRHACQGYEYVPMRTKS